ncbi:hypothetical protein ACN9MD_09545 [Stenotrophomonas maltophilia]|uniref:hypothetical protein n=1 Tax=Stenotrophomonas maltophilia TaxID=40324 RepID=UPI003CFB9D9B
MTTDNKTLAVDVLEVLDRLVAASCDSKSNYFTEEEIQACRAAVAELIEADEELIAAEMRVAGYEAMTRYSSRNYRTACYVREREAIARRRAALARVKGESA